MKPGFRKIVSVLQVLLPPCVAGLVFCLSYRPPFIIHPASPAYELGPVSDSQGVGDSVIHRLEREPELQLEYTVGTGLTFPYVGFYFRFSDGPVGIDITGYDYLQLTMRTEKARSVKLNLKFFLEGFTRVTDPGSFYPLEYELAVSNRLTRYKIPLKRFSSLFWWFQANNLPPDMEIFGYADNLYNFQILNGDLPRQERDVLSISSIGIYKSPRSLLLALAGGVILYYLGLVGLRQWRKRRPAAAVSAPVGDPRLDRILAVMQREYRNPDFSIWDVGRETALTNRRISALIKSARNQSFTQWLNELRIEEATRLLKTTDRKATDIAFEVGYNNYTHFTREFKKRRGVSAREYRRPG